MLRLPPLPEPLRGAFMMSLRLAYNGTAEDGERMVAPLRTVGPGNPRHRKGHAVQLKRSVAELLDGMRPWQSDRRLVNNLAPVEAPDAAAIYGPERYTRLAAAKLTHDPATMFRINHNVVPAT
ncbi:hypothetical protein [Amycolatopsis sp. NPDC051372]|uniref:hypothetical protein n=1 Tax=Amycolatopsis sp. NPDC051372 TaxID=3155669 RepID=UPI0034331BFA